MHSMFRNHPSTFESDSSNDDDYSYHTSSDDDEEYRYIVNDPEDIRTQLPEIEELDEEDTHKMVRHDLIKSFFDNRNFINTEK